MKRPRLSRVLEELAFILGVFVFVAVHGAYEDGYFAVITYSLFGTLLLLIWADMRANRRYEVLSKDLK